MKASLLSKLDSDCILAQRGSVIESPSDHHGGLGRRVFELFEGKHTPKGTEGCIRTDYTRYGSESNRRRQTQTENRNVLFQSFLFPYFPYDRSHLYAAETSDGMRNRRCHVQCS
jgi:hypothetical protein